MEQLGVIEGLRRYPVKSMAGEDVRRVFVHYAGLVGDRIYALLARDGKATFPWLTARQYPGLLRYQPRFVELIDPELVYPDQRDLAVVVHTPGGTEVRIDDPQFLDELRSRFHCEPRLRFSERGMQDARPVSIIGQATLAQIGREVEGPIDARRFRANFYVRWSNSAPFFEDTLVGQKLRIGEKLTVHVSRRTVRCKMIGLDPDEGADDPRILRTVAREHGGCAGVYAVVLHAGFAELGAPVYRDASP